MCSSVRVPLLPPEWRVRVCNAHVRAGPLPPPHARVWGAKDSFPPPPNPAPVRAGPYRSVPRQYVVTDQRSADDLVHSMLPRSRRFQDDAQDYFIVRRGTFPWSTIPAFVVGRPAYDNWLLDYAEHHDFDTVDVSKTVHAIHQTGTDGNKAGHVVRWPSPPPPGRPPPPPPPAPPHLPLAFLVSACLPYPLLRFSPSPLPSFIPPCLPSLCPLPASPPSPVTPVLPASRAPAQARPDKDWNVPLANEQFDHGRMRHCRFETYEVGGSLAVRARRRRFTRPKAE